MEDNFSTDGDGDERCAGGKWAMGKAESVFSIIQAVTFVVYISNTSAPLQIIGKLDPRGWGPLL